MPILNLPKTVQIPFETLTNEQRNAIHTVMTGKGLQNPLREKIQLCRDAINKEIALFQGADLGEPGGGECPSCGNTDCPSVTPQNGIDIIYQLRLLIFWLDALEVHTDKLSGSKVDYIDAFFQRLSAAGSYSSALKSITGKNQEKFSKVFHSITGAGDICLDRILNPCTGPCTDGYRTCGIFAVNSGLVGLYGCTCTTPVAHELITCHLPSFIDCIKKLIEEDDKNYCQAKKIVEKYSASSRLAQDAIADPLISEIIKSIFATPELKQALLDVQKSEASEEAIQTTSQFFPEFDGSDGAVTDCEGSPLVVVGPPGVPGEDGKDGCRGPTGMPGAPGVDGFCQGGNNPCGGIQGACCINGFCLELTSQQCQVYNGNFYGEQSTCEADAQNCVPDSCGSTDECPEGQVCCGSECVDACPNGTMNGGSCGNCPPCFNCDNCTNGCGGVCECPAGTLCCNDTCMPACPTDPPTCPTCQGGCCPQGYDCCGGDGCCPQGQCCNGECCGSGSSCCGGECCSGDCCGGSVCCSGETPNCCGDSCCANDCCGGECCNDDAPCCTPDGCGSYCPGTSVCPNDEQCNDGCPCDEGDCCEGETECCANDGIEGCCEGSGCTDLCEDGSCPDDTLCNNGCGCPPNDTDGEEGSCCGDGCCYNQKCCEDSYCCGLEQCCNGNNDCCDAGLQCCGDGVCCPEGTCCPGAGDGGICQPECPGTGGCACGDGPCCTSGEECCNGNCCSFTQCCGADGVTCIDRCPPVDGEEQGACPGPSPCNGGCPCGSGAAGVGGCCSGEVTCCFDICCDGTCTQPCPLYNGCPEECNGEDDCCVADGGDCCPMDDENGTWSPVAGGSSVDGGSDCECYQWEYNEEDGSFECTSSNAACDEMGLTDYLGGYCCPEGFTCCKKGPACTEVLVGGDISGYDNQTFCCPEDIAQCSSVGCVGRCNECAAQDCCESDEVCCLGCPCTDPGDNAQCFATGCAVCRRQEEGCVGCGGAGTAQCATDADCIPQFGPLSCCRPRPEGDPFEGELTCTFNCGDPGGIGNDGTGYLKGACCYIKGAGDSGEVFCVDVTRPQCDRLLGIHYAGESCPRDDDGTGGDQPPEPPDPPYACCYRSAMVNTWFCENKDTEQECMEMCGGALPQFTNCNYCGDVYGKCEDGEAGSVCNNGVCPEWDDGSGDIDGPIFEGPFQCPSIGAFPGERSRRGEEVQRLSEINLPKNSCGDVSEFCVDKDGLGVCCREGQKCCDGQCRNWNQHSNCCYSEITEKYYYCQFGCCSTLDLNGDVVCQELVNGLVNTDSCPQNIENSRSTSTYKSCTDNERIYGSLIGKNLLYSGKDTEVFVAPNFDNDGRLTNYNVEVEHTPIVGRQSELSVQLSLTELRTGRTKEEATPTVITAPIKFQIVNFLASKKSKTLSRPSSKTFGALDTQSDISFAELTDKSSLGDLKKSVKDAQKTVIEGSMTTIIEADGTIGESQVVTFVSGSNIRLDTNEAKNIIRINVDDLNLWELSDVYSSGVSGATNGDVLQYSSALGKWNAVAVPAGPSGPTGPVAGSSKEIIYNADGGASASPNLTFDYTNAILGVTADVHLYQGFTAGGTCDFQDNVVVKANLKDYAETVYAVGQVNSSTAFNLENGNVQTVTVGGIDTGSTITFSFSNPPSSGNAGSVTLIMTNPMAHGDVAWHSSVKWSGGTAPSLSSSGTDILSFTTLDAGTTWYGFVGGIGMS